jgi:hypothetical protein
MIKYKVEETRKIEILIDLVTNQTGVDILRIPKKRYRSLTDSRAIFMYLARKNTKYSLADIGLVFKTSDYRGKDHATVLHQFKKIKNFLDVKDPQVVNLIAKCDKLFEQKCIDESIKIEGEKKLARNLVKTEIKYRAYCLHSRITMRGKLNDRIYA